MMLSAVALTELQTGPDVDLAAFRLIRGTIESDEVMHVQVALTGEDTTLRTGPDLLADEAATQALARVGHLHPAVLSYLEPGDDRSPRRVSDVVSNQRWWSSSPYSEVFRERGGRYQLSLVTRLSATTGAGWVLTRCSHDFTDDDVEVARLLLPQLVTMGELAKTKPAAEACCDPLTTRERAVLDLLATGISAAAIAHRLGITEATTRKHLAHIYAKLGVHDRLSAVLALGRPHFMADVDGDPAGRGSASRG
jgi:DNA-binding CsgD family transcriptional regulator